MATLRLIKRSEVTVQQKERCACDQAATTQSIVQEWMKQYQTAQPANVRAAFAALFAQPQISK